MKATELEAELLNKSDACIDDESESFRDRADELYRIVIEQSKTLVIEYDYLQEKTYIDPLLSKYIQGDFSELTPTNVASLHSAVYRPDFPDLQQLLRSADAAASIHQTKEIRFYTVERSYEWFRVVVSVIVDGDGKKQRAIITLNNINDEVLARKKLEFLAEQDSLTRIPNKDTFFEKTRMILDREPNEQHVIIRFDIERFHMLNQILGVPEGDRVLKFLAVKLQELFGLEEQISYCRLSSDAFAVCTRYESAEIDELVKTIQGSFQNYPLEYEFTLCFGLYIVDDPKLPIDTMLDRAAHAQKTVKGNYILHKAYYDDALREQENHQREIINDMTRALHNGEFEVYYQVKVHMDSQEPVGAEALVRWNHPHKGMIPPGVFIPLFEKNGFVMQVDLFVWKSVCRQIRMWLDSGIDLKPISVNVSRADLYNPRLVDVILSVTDEYEVPRKLLQLELTESSFVSDAARLASVTAELRQAGFTILMDDFGSGYSSLTSLTDIDVDVLKLDMQFLTKSIKTEKGTWILKHTIDMAESIGLTVLAEGVETPEDCRKLLGLGCHYAQGYFFSKPIPVNEYEKKFLIKESV